MSENQSEAKTVVRFLVFGSFLGSCLWTANMAYTTNSVGFGWLAFFLFLGAASSATNIFELK